MAKLAIPALIIYSGLISGALSQPAPVPPAPPPGQTSAQGPLLRGDHITATGETVPLPGRSQSDGPTDLDRNIERKDTQIQNSICKGC